MIRLDGERADQIPVGGCTPPRPRPTFSIISADALPLPIRLRFAVATRTPALALASVVALSTALRGVIAWHHATPRYFPDEYIYAALGRSLGHGHLAIRGGSAFFPGILEPVIAAPLWRLFDTATAYHLVQLENAFVASLAAIPVYVLARQLGVRSPWALCCSLYAVALPSLVLVAYTMSDTLGYTLVLGALAAGTASLQEPTRRRQVLFLVLATLASLTRVEYFAVVPAYAVAAIVLDRRAALRRHLLAFAALAPAAGVVLLAVFGYYSQGVRATRVDLNYAKWFFIQPFLLALEAGAAIVPGAIAGLVGARGRRAVGFATLVSCFAILIVAQATAHAADSLQFKERYLFVLLALLPPAFAVHARDPRRGRLVVVGAGCALLIAAARVPISGYDAATFKSDSQFLLSIADASNWFGVANMSLAIGLAGAVGAAAGVVASLRGRFWMAPVIAASVAVALTVQASRVDLRATSSIRDSYPGSLTWIDDAGHGLVTALATPLSPQSDLLTQLWWNQRVQREAVLDTALPTDAFARTRVHVGRSGVLAGVHGELLVDGYGTTATLLGAEQVAHNTNFVLWRTNGAPRFRTLVEGRFYDEWLADRGRIRAFPAHRGSAVRMAFRLSVPSDWTSAGGIRLGRATLTLSPGTAVDVTCTSTSGPVDLRFRSGKIVYRYSGFFRRLSVRMTRIRVADVAAGAGAGCTVRRAGASA